MGGRTLVSTENALSLVIHQTDLSLDCESMLLDLQLNLLATY